MIEDGRMDAWHAVVASSGKEMARNSTPSSEEAESPRARVGHSLFSAEPLPELERPASCASQCSPLINVAKISLDRLDSTTISGTTLVAVVQGAPLSW